MNIFETHLLNVLIRDNNSNKLYLKDVGIRLAGIYSEILKLNIKSSLKENLINLLEILKNIFGDESYFKLEDEESFFISHNFINISFKELAYGIIEGYLNICLLKCKVIQKKKYFIIEKIDYNINTDDCIY